VLESWGLYPSEAQFFRTEIDIAAGQPEIARARLVQLGTINLSDAEMKRREELLKQLPPAPAGAETPKLPANVRPPEMGAAPVAPAPVLMDDDDDW
jgi:hypothetical protein